MDLREFLTTRLAEDEAQARDAASRNAAEWTCPVSAVLDIGDDDDLVLVHDSGVGEHIARWDPARVLAETAAKRRLLNLAFEYAADWDARNGCRHTIEQIKSGKCLRVGAFENMLILRLLAAPYVDHPDYDQGWRIGIEEALSGKITRRGIA